MTRPGARRPRGKSRLAVVLLSIAATGLIALGAIAAAYYFGRDALGQIGAQPPSPTAAQQLDERGTCELFIPLGQDVTALVLEFVAHPDGTTTDWSKMAETVRNLETVQAIAHPSMQADIGEQAKPLKQLLDIRNGAAPNGSVEFEGLRQSGMRTGARCLAYAS